MSRHQIDPSGSTGTETMLPRYSYPRSSLLELHTLPDEILSLIFSFALHLCDAQSEPLSTIYIPLDISHVCARWRRVALSCSSLWTRLVLYFPAIDKTQITRTLAWLTRSKQQPIEISLDFRCCEWWESDEADTEEEEEHPVTAEMMERVLDLLIPHIERWKTFEVLTDTWEPIHTFLRITRHFHENQNRTEEALAPQLQSLALSRCNAYLVEKGASFYPDHPSLKDPIPLFGGPKLREVSLTGVHVDWTRSGCLRNLHHLELKYHSADVMPSLEEFEGMLEACPELKRLTVLGWGPMFQSDDGTSKGSTSEERSQSKRVITLTSLKDLSYGFVDVDYAVEFLSLFSLPSLRKLELQDLTASLNFGVDGPLDSAPIIDRLILNQRLRVLLNQIECLKLEGLRASKQAFTRFLRAFTSLRKICLSDADPPLMSALHPGAGRKVLPAPIVVEGRERRRSYFASGTCPQLADMVCRRVDYKSLSEVVSARCQEGSGVKRLETLEIDSSGDECEEEGSGSSRTFTKEDHEVLVKTGVGLIVHGKDPDREARV
ncbi:hypothetical protein V5O48_017873 [Marasmius crinis-equi]|uniref:F-box domain-containing protein n=1 Tax=Marasmius crinis-equi TaxID=585013 RepID=A0ABR3EMV9_9AGAR